MTKPQTPLAWTLTIVIGLLVVAPLFFCCVIGPIAGILSSNQ